MLLAPDEHAGRVYELAGDDAYTLGELAAAISGRVGREIGWVDLPPERMRSALEAGGVPADLAGLLADSDAGAAEGALFDDGRRLSRLLGRPTTPWRVTLDAVLKDREHA